MFGMFVGCIGWKLICVLLLSSRLVFSLGGLMLILLLIFCIFGWMYLVVIVLWRRCFWWLGWVIVISAMVRFWMFLLCR